MGAHADHPPAHDSRVSPLCFHCNEPLLGSKLTARIDDRREPVCCIGCQAVAELIATAGFSDYYEYRSAPALRPNAAALAPDNWSSYADPEVANRFVRRHGEADEANLLIDGLRCAACSWLIDQVVRKIEGVRHVSVNAATGRAHIEWRRSDETLAQVMRAIAQLGYRPHPLTSESAAKAQQDEWRSALKRAAVATFGMMQVMMFAFSVYSTQLSGEVMEANLLAYFRIVSLLVATPVMFYAGAPFLIGAWNSLRARSVGMDVPVAIALVLAYSASVWNTLRGEGELYFDSVTMFIFFLTLGRLVTMGVRHRTTSITDALARQSPAVAHRLTPTGSQDVAVSSLQPGQLILVRSGEVIPVDGELIDTEASIDEAMLTGESLPVHRHPGDRVAAGTLNTRHPIQVRVGAVGAGTVLSHIVTLLQRAQAQKPALSCAADKAAARFLTWVLVGAGLTCAVWLAIDPTRAFEATLAVLVVACPCAFAIAMPAALSAATAQLAQYGVLVTRPDALQALAGVDTVVFDKTGTLTLGEIRIERCEPLAHLDKMQCLALAAALEQASEHPLARAFARFSDGRVAEAVRTIPGGGVEGVIEGGTYRIGTANFVAELRGATPGDSAPHEHAAIVVLGDAQRELARFELHDQLRPSARDIAKDLDQLDIGAQILSGDGRDAVAEVAQASGVREFFARRSPPQKLAHVRELQEQGKRVAMIGDGVNDAPVLGAANVSIAMGRGAALAQATADMVIVSEDLDALPRAIALARRTLRIARQNLIWAAAYNFGSLPLAALGYIPPWLAALGMSISSAAVVVNAMRLLPGRGARDLGLGQESATSGRFAIAQEQRVQP